MENITQSCRNISVPVGFAYKVLPHVLSHLTNNIDCEQGWYNTKWEFVSGGQRHVNQTRHQLVVEENRENITLSTCMDLHHIVECPGSRAKILHFYKVLNETSPIQKVVEQQSDNSWMIAGVLILAMIVVLLIVVLRYRKRRWIAGVWRRSVFGCWQQTDEDNGNRLENREEGNSETCQLNTATDENMNGAAVNTNGCKNKSAKNGEAQPLKDTSVTDLEPPEHSQNQ